MFAVSIYTVFMGHFYDQLLVNHLPPGANLEQYLTAAPGTPMADALNQAKSLAGPEVLQATLVIPIILILAFGGLFLYMRSKRKKGDLVTA